MSARFKPANAARRSDYAVSPVSLQPARALVAAHHYAKGAANTAVLSMGLFRLHRLVGAALWIPPTRRCAESVCIDDWKRVLSLSRLVVTPGEPTNAASLLIGACVRHIADGGAWSWLVTFADASQGHTGVIYRATNWTYCGITKPEPRWEDAKGRQVSRQAGPRSRTAAEMRELGYRCAGSFAKHKFVMRVPERRRRSARQIELFDQGAE